MDFSPNSLLAFSFAASIAEHYEGMLLLEHVTRVEDAVQPFPSEAAINKMQFVMEEALTGAEKSLRNIPHELIFERGDVCSRLLATASERGTNLIVVGTHGIRGMRKLLNGSTAEEIVSRASCPVLTAGPRVDGPADFHRVLCAIELSPASGHAIPYALSLAQQYDSSLVFLHVNDSSGDERPVDTKSQTLKFVDEQIRHSGCDQAVMERARIIVDFGPRTELILEAATHYESDLIVMGLHTHRRVSARVAAHLPGPMAYDLIAQARCPIMTVPLPRAA